MKVYYLVLVSAFCVWTISPVQSQWFYSHYTQFAPQPLPYTHFIPQQTYNFAPQLRQPAPLPPSTGDYRGFGYHTNFQDGASSTVYFVTGPEAFSNFRTTLGKVEPPRARNLASDITDTNAIPDINAHLQSILQPAEFQQLFDSRSAGVVNFYYPADTVPLLQINNGTTELTTSTAATTTTTTASSEEATTIANIPESEAEPAESILENTRLRFNVIEDTSSTSTTTVSTTTAAAALTEAATVETSTETTESPENPETTTVEESTTVV